MTINVEPLWDWVAKRHSIYIKQAIYRGEVVFSQDIEAGLNADTSNEPILNNYRFCNVFRELDRVTRWVKVNIRDLFDEYEYLWLMLAIARVINWPDTLSVLMFGKGTWPVDANFSPSKLAQVLEWMQNEGRKVYTGAYLVRPESNQNRYGYGLSKSQYVGKIVIGQLWDDREQLSEFFEHNRSVQEAHKRLTQYYGWGSFMAYQVCVDMMHTRYLQNAPDSNTWAALGPGSTRGLNRLAGRPVNQSLRQADGLNEMRRIFATQDKFRPSWVPRVGLSDIQNCLCETDKYLRAKNGEGRLRNHYRPMEG